MDQVAERRDTRRAGPELTPARAIALLEELGVEYAILPNGQPTIFDTELYRRGGPIWAIGHELDHDGDVRDRGPGHRFGRFIPQCSCGWQERGSDFVDAAELRVTDHLFTAAGNELRRRRGLRIQRVYRSKKRRRG